VKNLSSSLKLSYSPMTVYEFDHYRSDKDIYDFLRTTTLYIIAKRSLPFMSLIEGNPNKIHLFVEMENNTSSLEILILKQDNEKLFGTGLTQIGTGNNTKSRDKFHSITLYGENERFIMNANLDRLIHLASNNLLRIRTKGDITPFVNYEVLYVGQCIGEHIFDRFKTHHALLDILINENIITSDYDKINDLIIMPFQVESDVLSIITGDSSEEEFTEAMLGSFCFDHNTISLDCEKALIKAMNPKYNKTKFTQYPKSKDGLYNYNLESFTYRILENIILDYGEEHYIYGDVESKELSIIAVSKNQEFFIYGV